ncbi:MAG: dihydrodipicolinate synthase family protein [Hyphomicrobiales bacterium]|nr:MAG: dihydrodipicolinate synthase family protein [Hyphomicrobiales bacterium]
MTAPSPLRGVIAPILTPFNEDLSVATDLYVDNAKRLLDAGCVGLAPFGTTGEALSVGIDERIEVLEALIKAGIDPKWLVPGTGLTNLADTARLTRHAVERGCAGAMILPPFYFKNVPEDGLFAYFATLLDWVADDRLKVYLYHIPQVSGVGLPVSLVRRLYEAFPEQIVGIKDSSGDWENTRALLEIDGLIVYPGSELPLIDALDLGGPGCISATANLNATAIAEVVALYDEGRRDAAEARHASVRGFRKTVEAYAPIPAQKRLLSLASGDARWAVTRPPLLPLAEDRGQELADKLKSEFSFEL